MVSLVDEMKFDLEEVKSLDHAHFLAEEAIRQGDVWAIKGEKELSIYYYRKAKVYESIIEKM